MKQQLTFNLNVYDRKIEKRLITFQYLQMIENNIGKWANN